MSSSSGQLPRYHALRTLPPPPCPHLSVYRSAAAAGNAAPLRSLRRCLRPLPPGRAELLRDPLELPRCSPCSSHSNTNGVIASNGSSGGDARLYACLACAAVTCPAHAAAHAASRAGHEIGVDVDRAELYCGACGDQVYDADFDAAVVLTHRSFATGPPPPPEKPWKRRRVEYRPWIPDPKEKVLMGRGPSAVAPGSDTWAGGLRGLNNLGNTCFMNSVLQALLHAPPMRNYFLSDRHNQEVCQRRGSKKKKSGIGAGVEDGGLKVCLACDLDAMYSAVFSGDQKPYSPARFLYSWWQHASNLATYEQQDAHEFFISMLDGIHEKVEEDRHKPHGLGKGDCCIAHRVFSGTLRSDVTCTNCGFTSTTYDPCVDISLDLDTSQGSGKVGTSKSHASNGDTGLTPSALSSGVSTLRGCLERFTRPEKLGPDQKLFCQHCQVRQESLKQMSIRKLPLVTCFHIKRFEHSSIRKMSRKVDRFLQFPFFLDMAPFLSSSILRNRFGNRLFAFDGEDSDASMELASEFELFAVITHSGRLDAGHYITYLRLSNQWYKCDDAWITKVSDSSVRTSQAYMLFYVQKMLYYRASDNFCTS